MATNVSMPQLGESVVEGTIAKWLVKEGEAVREDQALVEVTTDKIDTEIPSPASGVIGKILVAEGETVAIGAVLCEIVAAGTIAGSGDARGTAGTASPKGTPSGKEATPPGRETIPSRAAAAAPKTTRPPEGRSRVEARGAESVVGSRAPAERPAAAAEPSRGGEAATLVRSARGQRDVGLDEERTDAARERRRAASSGAGNGAPAQERRITPVVRKMAAEQGIDLSALRGTGVGGRVTKQDLLEHLAAAGPGTEADAGDYGDYGDTLGLEGPPLSGKTSPPAARRRGGEDGQEADVAAEDRRLLVRRDGSADDRAGQAARREKAQPARTRGLDLREYSPPVVEPLEGDTLEPFSKRRKIIAEHMVYSKATSPHVYTMAEVDMAGVAAIRESRKRAFKESEGVSLTFLHFVIAAAVRALREFPRMNAVVADEELIVRRDVNMGIAVETEQGLVVPVVKQADRLSLRGLARAVEELAVRSRERKLKLEDLQGGTFTISNPGREGNLIGFAIINQPQLGILRMGEIKKRPVVVEHEGGDAIVVRPIMLLSLSYDHRVIDGVTGNSFLYRVKEILEQAEFDV